MRATVLPTPRVAKADDAEPPRHCKRRLSSPGKRLHDSLASDQQLKPFELLMLGQPTSKTPYLFERPPIDVLHQDVGKLAIATYGVEAIDFESCAH